MTCSIRSSKKRSFTTKDWIMNFTLQVVEQIPPQNELPAAAGMSSTKKWSSNLLPLSGGSS